MQGALKKSLQVLSGRPWMWQVTCNQRETLELKHRRRHFLVGLDAGGWNRLFGLHFEGSFEC